MTLRDKIIKALEPFARSSTPRQGLEPEGNIGGSALTNGDLQRAAEVLAELRKPTGFKEWLYGEWVDRIGLNRPGSYSYAEAMEFAYDAGQLSSIPADLKKACIDMATELEAEARQHAASSPSSKAKLYEVEASRYAKIRERLGEL